MDMDASASDDAREACASEPPSSEEERKQRKRTKRKAKDGPGASGRARGQHHGDDEDSAFHAKYVPWTKQEDDSLRQLVLEHGAKNWSNIAVGLPSRTSKSCRLRWLNQLRPNVQTGSFTPEEDQIIIEAQATMGNKWTAIAARLPGRTDNAVKNRWNSALRKRVEGAPGQHEAQQRVDKKKKERTRPKREKRESRDTREQTQQQDAAAQQQQAAQDEALARVPDLAQQQQPSQQPPSQEQHIPAPPRMLPDLGGFGRPVITAADVCGSSAANSSATGPFVMRDSLLGRQQQQQQQQVPPPQLWPAPQMLRAVPPASSAVVATSAPYHLAGLTRLYPLTSASEAVAAVAAAEENLLKKVPDATAPTHIVHTVTTTVTSTAMVAVTPPPAILPPPPGDAGQAVAPVQGASSQQHCFSMEQMLKSQLALQMLQQQQQRAQPPATTAMVASTPPPAVMAIPGVEGAAAGVPRPAVTWQLDAAQLTGFGVPMPAAAQPLQPSGGSGGDAAWPPAIKAEEPAERGGDGGTLLPPQQPLLPSGGAPNLAQVLLMQQQKLLEQHQQHQQQLVQHNQLVQQLLSGAVPAAAAVAPAACDPAAPSQPQPLQVVTEQPPHVAHAAMAGLRHRRSYTGGAGDMSAAAAAAVTSHDARVPCITASAVPPSAMGFAAAAADALPGGRTGFAAMLEAAAAHAGCPRLASMVIEGGLEAVQHLLTLGMGTLAAASYMRQAGVLPEGQDPEAQRRAAQQLMSTHPSAGALVAMIAERGGEGSGGGGDGSAAVVAAPDAAAVGMEHHAAVHGDHAQMGRHQQQHLHHLAHMPQQQQPDGGGAASAMPMHHGHHHHHHHPGAGAGAIIARASGAAPLTRDSSPIGSMSDLFGLVENSHAFDAVALLHEHGGSHGGAAGPDSPTLSVGHFGSIGSGMGLHMLGSDRALQQQFMRGGLMHGSNVSLGGLLDEVVDSGDAMQR